MAKLQCHENRSRDDKVGYKYVLCVDRMWSLTS